MPGGTNEQITYMIIIFNIQCTKCKHLVYKMYFKITLKFVLQLEVAAFLFVIYIFK